MKLRPLKILLIYFIFLYFASFFPMIYFALSPLFSGAYQIQIELEKLKISFEWNKKQIPFHQKPLMKSCLWAQSFINKEFHHSHLTFKWSQYSRMKEKKISLLIPENLLELENLLSVKKEENFHHHQLGLRCCCVSNKKFYAFHKNIQQWKPHEEDKMYNEISNKK